MRALQLYQAAEALRPSGDLQARDRARELLREAVAEDPRFVRARVSLAQVMEARQESVAEADRALVAAERVPEIERLFVTARAYQAKGLATAEPISQEQFNQRAVAVSSPRRSLSTNA